MVHIACPDTIEPLKSSSHILFFKFFESYLTVKYNGRNKYVVAAGSYPLYYFIKGNADTSEKKAYWQSFLKHFVPDHFNLWTNLDNVGDVINVIFEFVALNPGLRLDVLRIMDHDTRDQQRIMLKFLPTSTQELSICVQVTCWHNESFHRITNRHNLLRCVVETFDISVCKIGWLSATKLERILPYNRRVLLDIKEKQFSVTFKHHENMHMVQKRLRKYMTRGFHLRELVFPCGFVLHDVIHHSVADTQDEN